MINELKLDLACGQNKTPGFFGVDVANTEGVDAVVDLEQYPWPIESNSAEEIVCSHYIEHTPVSTLDKDIMLAILESSTLDELKAKVQILKDKPSSGLIKFMEEIYRILKPGGKVAFITPYYTSIRCWQDPTHTRAISEATFLYYNKAWREANKLDHYNITCDFDFVYGYNVMPEWATRSQEARDFAIRNYNNAVSDIQVTLTKK